MGDRPMSFYGDRILPWLVDRAMANEDLLDYRRRVIGAARGRVLEIGIGSGLNLPFYGPGVDEVIGLDPSSPLLTMAQGQVTAGAPVSMMQGTAEAIPLETASMDTVVTTWTLCSIPDVTAAL